MSIRWSSQQYLKIYFLNKIWEEEESPARFHIQLCKMVGKIKKASEKEYLVLNVLCDFKKKSLIFTEGCSVQSIVVSVSHINDVTISRHFRRQVIYTQGNRGSISLKIQLLNDETVTVPHNKHSNNLQFQRKRVDVRK